MKLGDCWKGRMVRYRHCSYEEAIDQLEFGHVVGIKQLSISKEIKILVERPRNKIYSLGLIEYFPEELIPMED